jgi:hypothetical protein
VRELLMLLVLVCVPGVVLVAGWRLGRFRLAFAAVAVLLLGVWGASLIAIETDYRDGDGFIDCWPSCTAYHDAVGVAFWGALPLLVGLVVVTTVLAVGVSALRRRAARRPG